MSVRSPIVKEHPKALPGSTFSPLVWAVAKLFISLGYRSPGWSSGATSWTKLDVQRGHTLHPGAGGARFQQIHSEISRTQED